MKIALTISNPIRDMAGTCLLALALCKSGHSCFVVPHGLWRQELGQLAPDFVLLTNARRSSQEVAQALTSMGSSVGVLDAEGGVFSSWDWYGDALMENEVVRSSLSCFLSWGPLLAEQAQQRGWFGTEQVHVTGSPRFDFYAPALRGLSLPGAPDPSRWGREALRKRPLVLINGRYSIANPHNMQANEKLKRMAWLRDYSEEKVQRILDAQREGMSTLAALANDLARDYPTLDFVYRPHPFERLETYEELLNLERDNLHLERSGDISGWLKACDVVIARGCTTAIEMGMLDKVALSPLWIRTSEEIESAESVSVGCKDEEELRSWLSRLQAGEVLAPPLDVATRHAKVVNDWFYKVDGNAHERVADAIINHLPRGGAVDTKAYLQTFQEDRFTRSEGKAFWKKWRRSPRSRSVRRNANWKQSESKFDADEVSSMIQAIAKNSEEFESLVVHVDYSRDNGDYQTNFPAGVSVSIFSR